MQANANHNADTSTNGQQGMGPASRPRARLTLAGLSWAFACCLAVPCLADTDAKEMEKGTNMIIDMILEEKPPAQTSQQKAIAAAQAAESLKISESEEVIDLSTLSEQERAALEASVGIWMNQADPADAPPTDPIELVEPIQFKESSEQVVDASELTPELLAEFPEMQTAPLPTPAADIPVAAPVAAVETQAAPEVSDPVAKRTQPEEVEPVAAEKETQTSVKKTAQAPVSMPRVTRWGGRPAPN